MEPIKESTGKVVKISRKKFAGIIVLLIVGAIGYSIYNFLTNSASLSTTSRSAPSLNLGGVMGDSYDYSIQAPSRPTYQQDSTINDTREYLKTSYSSTIKTRDVSGVVTDVKNMVKGADGRIDGSSSSEKSGYVSFVVPKSNFDSFRDQVEASTHRKLYAENISSQNLLGQKQSIEGQRVNLETSLEQYQKQKDTLTANHTKTLNTLTKELADTTSELTILRASISAANSTTTDSQIIVALRNQETMLMQRESSQKSKISQENSSYSSQKQSLENTIKSYNTSLSNNTTQDVQLLNNVETVNGSVSVRWVSYWEILGIYSPIPPTLVVIVLGLGSWIYFRRKGVIPSILFV